MLQGGLHSSITEEVLWNLFSRFGEVKSCRCAAASNRIQLASSADLSTKFVLTSAVVMAATVLKVKATESRYQLIPLSPDRFLGSTAVMEMQDDEVRAGRRSVVRTASGNA